jgi:BMFP domain-containing protein YqiC
MMSTAGHPTALHIIDGEAYRRIMSGMAPDTLGQFAEQLLDWLHESHPGAARVTQHDVENQIRETWYRRHEFIRGG